MTDTTLNLEARLAQLNITLPAAPKPVASYTPALTVPAGETIFISGQIPMRDGSPVATGRVGAECSLEEGIECARQCTINALAALKAHLGSLDRIERIAKVEGFVACDVGFGDQPKVINGCSDLLQDILGERGVHARAAVGVPALPLNVPVEIAFTVIAKPA